MNREHIILMADASGLSLYGMGKDRDQFIDYLERFAALVASAEREACAKVCDRYVNSSSDHEAGTAMNLQDAIRARGQA